MSEKNDSRKKRVVEARTQKKKKKSGVRGSRSLLCFHADGQSQEQGLYIAQQRQNNPLPPPEKKSGSTESSIWDWHPQKICRVLEAAPYEEHLVLKSIFATGRQANIRVALILFT